MQIFMSETLARKAKDTTSGIYLATEFLVAQMLGSLWGHSAEVHGRASASRRKHTPLRSASVLSDLRPRNRKIITKRDFTRKIE
jgi:hypothetical protein